MLKSMTGFGRGEFMDNDHRFTVEIKAVNHRYNDIVIRMPKNLGVLEDKIRRNIANILLRGRIEVFITVDEYSTQKRVVRVDKELAIAYHNALRELSDLFSTSMPESAYNIAKYPDVIRVENEEEDINMLWPKLSQALEIAVANLVTMRTTEGASIFADLSSRINKLELYVDGIEKRAPQILNEYREKLLTRLRDLLSAVGAEFDETRVLQEAAIFADRMNFTEELVRLRSHILQFRTTLDTSEAIGRKLDFIVQEINRETNTIASKANDYIVANIVVEIKSEIEKVREQIQNIE